MAKPDAVKGPNYKSGSQKISVLIGYANPEDEADDEKAAGEKVRDTAMGKSSFFINSSASSGDEAVSNGISSMVSAGNHSAAGSSVSGAGSSAVSATGSSLVSSSGTARRRLNSLQTSNMRLGDVLETVPERGLDGLQSKSNKQQPPRDKKLRPKPVTKTFEEILDNIQELRNRQANNTGGEVSDALKFRKSNTGERIVAGTGPATSSKGPTPAYLSAGQQDGSGIVNTIVAGHKELDHTGYTATRKTSGKITRILDDFDDPLALEINQDTAGVERLFRQWGNFTDTCVDDWASQNYEIETFAIRHIPSGEIICACGMQAKLLEPPTTNANVPGTSATGLETGSSVGRSSASGRSAGGRRGGRNSKSMQLANVEKNMGRASYKKEKTILTLFATAKAWRRLGLGEALVWCVKKLYHEEKIKTIIVPATEGAVQFWKNNTNKGKEIVTKDDSDPLARLNYRRCKLIELNTEDHHHTELRLLSKLKLEKRFVFAVLLNEVKYGGETVVEAGKVKKLLDLANKEDVNLLAGDDRQTLLFDAVQRKDPQSAKRVTQMLLNSGKDLDINAADCNDQTALFYACNFNDRPDLISFLLQSGADPNHQDKNNETAIFYACRNGNPTAIMVLIEEGNVNLNHRSSRQKTCFDYAITKEKYHAGHACIVANNKILGTQIFKAYNQRTPSRFSATNDDSQVPLQDSRVAAITAREKSLVRPVDGGVAGTGTVDGDAEGGTGTGFDISGSFNRSMCGVRMGEVWVPNQISAQEVSAYLRQALRMKVFIGKAPGLPGGPEFDKPGMKGPDMQPVRRSSRLAPHRPSPPAPLSRAAAPKGAAQAPEGRIQAAGKNRGGQVGKGIGKSPSTGSAGGKRAAAGKPNTISGKNLTGIRKNAPIIKGGAKRTKESSAGTASQNEKGISAGTATQSEKGAAALSALTSKTQMAHQNIQGRKEQQRLQQNALQRDTTKASAASSNSERSKRKEKRREGRSQPPALQFLPANRVTAGLSPVDAPNIGNVSSGLGETIFEGTPMDNNGPHPGVMLDNIWQNSDTRGMSNSLNDSIGMGPTLGVPNQTMYLELLNNPMNLLQHSLQNQTLLQGNMQNRMQHASLQNVNSMMSQPMSQSGASGMIQMQQMASQMPAMQMSSAMPQIQPRDHMAYDGMQFGSSGMFAGPM